MEALDAWRVRNLEMAQLADVADIIFPSLYTFYDNHAEWAVYARANIAEARKYGKPVIPFLWFEYHTSTDLGGQLIDGDYWAKQLLVCRQEADGLVIWGGYLRSFDPKAPWWIETVKFLNWQISPPAGD